MSNFKQRLNALTKVRKQRKWSKDNGDYADSKKVFTFQNYVMYLFLAKEPNFDRADYEGSK